MTLRDHFLDVQVFNAIKSHPEPSTLEELAGRCVVESGPSRFRMPVELVRGVVRRLVVGGNVSEAGKRGARKLYRFDLGGKPVLPDGYLYDRIGTVNREPNVVIATPYNRITGGQLVFTLERAAIGHGRSARVFVSGELANLEAFGRKAYEHGFVYEPKRDGLSSPGRGFGYVSTGVDKLEELAAFVSRNDPR